MMKTYLKNAFQLSDSGAKGLVKSIWSFFLYYVSFVPPMICVFLFADRLLHGNTGKPVVYLLFMLVATLVMYLVINYNYKTTYDETYQESANLRIDLAEQLSKLPLSYFSKHNLSDLAQTIMADVASEGIHNYIIELAVTALRYKLNLLYADTAQKSKQYSTFGQPVYRPAIAILTSSHRQREKHAERHKEQYIFYDKCVLLGRHSPRLKQRNVNALP